MSRSLNKAMIIGNLGADPEIRSTASGSRVANLSVATNRRWTNAAGEQQEKTEWHKVVAWDSNFRKLADVAERYLKKGDQVYVEGEIEYRSYEDKDGVTRYVTEIRARELIMLGGREGGTRPGDESPAQRGRAGAGRQTSDYDDFQAPPIHDEDDDLPF